MLIAIFNTKWSNLYNILPNLNMNDSTPLKLQLCHVSPLQLNNNKGLRSWPSVCIGAENKYFEQFWKYHYVKYRFLIFSPKFDGYNVMIT